MDLRYFANQIDFEKINVSKTKADCYKYGEQFYHHLKKHIRSEYPSETTGDLSIYTGYPGIALLDWHLGSKLINFQPSIDRQDATFRLLQGCFPNLRKRAVTFLCGESGPLAIGAIMFYERGESGKNLYLDKLISGRDVALSPSTPDELLYGRAGYLYSLLFVKKHIPGAPVDSVIQDVVREILKSGQSGNKEFLYYEWHEKCYLGAAHGHVGILFLLLKAKSFLNDDELALVKKTLDWLMNSQLFASGNLKSSKGSKDDRLVHWCHGAPGAVHLFIQAHKVFNEDQYLQAAIESGNVIWTRGLLKKGYGLCHGVAGNAYGLMALYLHTNDESWQKKAFAFAEWTFEYGSKAERIPDSPLSLYEGLAGAVYMLFDFTTDSPTFPAFDI